MTAPTPPVAPERRTTRRRGDHVAPREFVKPTGVSPWPITLVAGDALAETARLAARASASDLIARTFWLSWKERAPHALGAIEGVRFEIASHDGTLDDFENALAHAATIAHAAKPHLIVVHGISQLDDAVKDWAREAAPAAFWQAYNDRWASIIDLLRSHDGPVVLIARLDGDTVIGHRDLADDADVLVRLAEDGSANVVATATEPPLHGELPDFEIETVWLLLKIGATA